MCSEGQGEIHLTRSPYHSKITLITLTLPPRHTQPELSHRYTTNKCTPPTHQQHQHLQLRTHASTAPTIQGLNYNTKGKYPNSHLMITFIVLIVRKLCLYQQNTNIRILEHPSLKSPHTRVCGKRRVYNKFNSIQNTITKPMEMEKPNIFTNIKTNKNVLSNTTINQRKTNKQCYMKTQHNTLVCPLTHKNAPKKFKIKSKLNHTHMYIHKERNNKSSTTHSLNQEHGINTKKHIKIFLKIPNICTKKKLNQTQLKPITPATEWTQNHTNRPLNYRKKNNKQKILTNKTHTSKTNILTPTLGNYNRYKITTNQNNNTTHRLDTKTLAKHRNTYTLCSKCLH